MLLFLEVKEMALTECLCPWRKRDTLETRGQESECWITVGGFIGLLGLFLYFSLLFLVK